MKAPTNRVKSCFCFIGFWSSTSPWSSSSMTWSIQTTAPSRTSTCWCSSPTPSTSSSSSLGSGHSAWVCFWILNVEINSPGTQWCVFLYVFRSTRQQILHRRCLRIRCRDPFWSWSWSSSAPWWWTGPCTSERLSWGRSSSRSSWSLAFTSGCSLSCRASQRSENLCFFTHLEKKTLQLDLQILIKWLFSWGYRENVSLNPKVLESVFSVKFKKKTQNIWSNDI